MSYFDTPTVKVVSVSSQTTLGLLEPGVLLTLSACVSLTLLSTNTLRYVFNLRARWVGLAVAMVVSLLSTALHSQIDWYSWVLVVPNAFIIFASSAGIAGMAAAKRPSRQLAKHAQAPIEEIAVFRRFWSPWFPLSE